ncbi:hypothetical protein KTO58_19845 [Chitinophaga pendula]|uniref:hypothetical protein n=1 Tax=Chitinophaga TaxID=79328 RepID=UPI000BAEB8A4|nr:MULTISPECIES: hypothetical protein [Chitinophaga]ASZ11079.1 hypothetical protein CK934_08955 [Chitinophaga sp. MD30]UCJ05924.1 hypothetical protein KTO58_19845 [Chitinophaga pendula]
MFKKLNIGSEERAVIVLGFCKGRDSSCTMLYMEEARLLIRHLKSRDPEEKKAEVMRRKIISMAHEMGWELPGGKADMRRIDGWCLQQMGLGKKLNQFNYNELPKLVSIFQKVYLQFFKAI